MPFIYSLTLGAFKAYSFSFRLSRQYYRVLTSSRIILNLYKHNKPSNFNKNLIYALLSYGTVHPGEIEKKRKI